MPCCPNGPSYVNSQTQKVRGERRREYIDALLDSKSPGNAFETTTSDIGLTALPNSEQTPINQPKLGAQILLVLLGQGTVFSNGLCRFPGKTVEGIVFGGPNYTQTPVCELNRIDAAVASPLVGVGNLPEDALVVGGATSRGGATAGSGTGRFVAGLGDPNAKVAGNVGDIFQRLDGEPGASFYVKESGNGGNAGWVPK